MDDENAIKRKLSWNNGEFSPDPNTQPRRPEKAKQSLDIADQVARFVASGGVIEKVPDGESNYEASPQIVINPARDRRSS